MKSLTDEHVLAAYVDGSDLDAVAPVLRTTLARFAVSGSWPSDQVLVVDQQHPPDPGKPEFLPQWDLGLNLGLDHLPRSSMWFAGVEAVFGLLRQLAAATGREFIVLLCIRSEPWRQEHLAFVGPEPIDLPWLQGAIVRLTALMAHRLD